MTLYTGRNSADIRSVEAEQAPEDASFIDTHADEQVTYNSNEIKPVFIPIEYNNYYH